MRALLVALLVIVGLAGIAAGVAYLVVPVHALPSFMPGHVAHGNGHLPKHGYTAIGVGVVLIVVGIVVGMVGKPKRHGSLR